MRDWVPSPQETSNQETEQEETEPYQEEPETQQEDAAEDKNIDKQLEEVRRYQVQSPRIDTLNGWPFEREPLEAGD